MSSWSAREEGTLEWLRNHREDLRYVLKQAVAELERARAAASAAEDQLRNCAKADVDFALADMRIARERLGRAERNVEWQNDKIMLLNAHGIITLNSIDQHREMSAEEVQWNRDLDAEKPLLQVTLRRAANQNMRNTINALANALADLQAFSANALADRAEPQAPEFVNDAQSSHSWNAPQAASAGAGS